MINSKTPSQAFKIGRDKKNPIRSDWQDIKEEVMMVALRLKFDQNPILKRKLIDTETRELIEHTVKDRYWADGGDGTGKNRLGILLMKLRSEYQSVQ